MLRFWPGDGDFGWARTVAEKACQRPGIAALGERQYAVLPSAGRGSVFETAIRLAGELLGRLLRGGTGREISGVLIFPGEVIVEAGRLTPVSESLLEDLDAKAPYLPPQGIFLTGYAASWLMGRHRFERLDFYDAPSGRRVPFFRLLGDATDFRPWHNPKLLGRSSQVERPTLDGALVELLDQQTHGQVVGGLGYGKTHAVWHALERRGEARIWIDFGHLLPNRPELLPRLLEQIGRLTPRALPDFRNLRHSRDLSPAAALDLARTALTRTAEALGKPPRLVLDNLQTVGSEDRDIVTGLLESQAAPCVLVHRLASRELRTELPTIEVPPMTSREARSHRQQLLEGLELDAELEERLEQVAAGNPLAFEEGLLGLLHGGRIRRVYGSFFFDGGHAGYESSARWVRHLEGEGQRLGNLWPLRLLAASGLEVPAEQIHIACTQLGLQLDTDWWSPYREADWLVESSSAWGQAFAFSRQALREALLHTLPGDSVTSLRHALGRVMAVGSDLRPADEWQAYRLLAGSPEALPSLLDFSRDSSETASRIELFEALVSEVRLHRQREGEPKTELNLLWSLLPLGRRLGRLHELEEELDRAVVLSVGHPKRHPALLTLKAELDLEKGRFAEAEKGLREALAASEGTDDRRRANIFIRLGDLLLRREHTQEAGELFRNLLEVVEPGGQAELVATCQYYLGNLALIEQRLEDAFEHHQKALEVRREQSPAALGASLSALGAVSLALGDYSRALVFYREAEETLERIEARAEELALARRGIGRALARLGNPTAATPMLRRALATCAGRDVIAEAGARLDFAENHLVLGNVGQALEEARQAHFHLSLIAEIALLGDAEQLLGRLALRQRRMGDARTHLEEARRIHLRHRDELAACHDTAWLLELTLAEGDREPMLANANRLEEMLRQIQSPRRKEVLLLRLFKAFEWLRHRQMPVPEARDYLRQACDELLRKTAFLEPDKRHAFLFQIPEHEELLDAATRHGVSLSGI